MIGGAAQWVVALGALELALGAASGWVLALAVDRPAALERVGVRSVRRIGQAHLDLIIMGVLLIAVGTAAPDLPDLPAVLLVVGAWVNALLFVPLAWRPDLTGNLVYKAVSTLSFACVTVGTAWVAVHLWP